MRLLGAEELDEAVVAAGGEASTGWAALSPGARDLLQRRVGEAADRKAEAAVIVRELTAAQ